MLSTKVRPAQPPPSSIVSIAEATTPSLPTAVAPVDLDCPLRPPQEASAALGSFSLEDMMEQSSQQEDIHELLKLIEVR